MARIETPRVALVTGASSGIGAATARELGRRGYAVVLVARRGERIDALATEIEAAGGRALALPGDVTKDEDRQTMIESTLRDFGRLDVLVNNAGRAKAGTTESLSPADVYEMFDLNVMAPIELTRLALPELKRRRGALVNVASMSAMIATPPVAIYAATKAALANWTEGLRRELTGSGVRVTLVNPGPIATEFAEAAGTEEAQAGFSGFPPERVAQAIARTLERPRRTMIVPSILAPAGWLVQTFPGLVDLAYIVLARYRPELLGQSAGEQTSVASEGAPQVGSART